MGDFLDYFKNKKNLANLLLLGIMVLAIPLAVQVVRQQQIIKSRAAADAIVFVGNNIVDIPGNKKGFKLNSAGRALIDLEINSPIESSALTAQSENILASFWPKDGLVETVRAAECEPGSSETCPDIEKCPNGSICASGHKYCVWKPDGNHVWSDCQRENDTCNQCSIMPPPGGTGIGSAQDGPGGCCDEGADDNSSAGCRRDSKPGGFREVCDISNGACTSGKSCRSETGCALDSDCGLPNNHCENGICKAGPPNKNCKVAGSIQARFNGTDNLTVAAGTEVSAGIFRNGTGVPMGAPVNGVDPVDSFTASITGPNGFSLNVSSSSTTSFKPTSGGKYTLTGTCGVNLSDSAYLTVTGSVCPADNTLTVSPASAKVGDAITFTYPAGKDGNIGGDTWSAGIDGTKCRLDLNNRKITCTAQSATENGIWSHYWNNKNSCASSAYKIIASSPSSSPSSGPSSSPSSGPSSSPSSGPSSSPPPVTTVSFRLAESPADFTETGEYGWRPYTSTPMRTNFEFKDKNTGAKNIWVEFKGSDGKPFGKKNAQIKLLSPDPAITSCSLTFDANNATVLNLTGTNFGTVKGTIKSGDTSLSTIKEWKDKSIKVIFPNTPEGEKLPVSVTSVDGQTSQEGAQCSAITQLSLGAKVFCRTASSQDTDNVDLTLTGDFPGGTKSKQKVKIDREGNIAGLNQRMEEGKKYKLTLKAPKSVRKTVSFTAVADGAINIPNFVLPIGDIMPVPGGDGIINSLDKGELNRQWIVAQSATGRSADFNGDSRVNSIDWACMRHDFGASDDPEPAAPLATPAPSISPTATPGGSSPAPSSNLPVGFLDTVDSSCIAYGWACDADNNDTPLDVHFYVGEADGGDPTGRETVIGAIRADQTRSDLAIAHVCGDKTNHGFTFPLPASLKDGKSHTLYAYGINIEGGNRNPLLRGAPKQFNCAAAP